MNSNLFCVIASVTKIKQKKQKKKQTKQKQKQKNWVSGAMGNEIPHGDASD